MDDDKDNDATDPKLIGSYMRSEALDDGVLVDVTEMAREAGFVIPVARTRAAWDLCVALSPAAERGADAGTCSGCSAGPLGAAAAAPTSRSSCSASPRLYAPRASRSEASWAPVTTDSPSSQSCCPTRVRPSASCLRDELVPVARRAGVRVVNRSTWTAILGIRGATSGQTRRGSCRSTIRCQSGSSNATIALSAIDPPRKSAIASRTTATGGAGAVRPRRSTPQPRPSRQSQR